MRAFSLLLAVVPLLGLAAGHKSTFDGCHLDVAASSDRHAFAHWLAVTMRDAETSAWDLARATGISDASISRYLSGDRAPTRDGAIRIARALGAVSGEALYALFQQRYGEKPSPGLERMVFPAGESPARMMVHLPAVVWMMYEDLAAVWKTKTLDAAIATATVALHHDLQRGTAEPLDLVADYRAPRLSAGTLEDVLSRAPFDDLLDTSRVVKASVPGSVKKAVGTLAAYFRADETFVLTAAAVRSWYLISSERNDFRARFSSYFPVQREDMRYSARKCSDEERAMVGDLMRAWGLRHELTVFETALANLYWDYHVALHETGYDIEAIHSILEPLLPGVRGPLLPDVYETAWAGRNSPREHSIRTRISPGILSAREELARLFGSVQTAEAVAIEREHRRIFSE